MPIQLLPRYSWLPRLPVPRIQRGYYSSPMASGASSALYDGGILDSGGGAPH
jgi:hypothetical protein